jgi:hypothetical protein
MSLLQGLPAIAGFPGDVVGVLAVASCLLLLTMFLLILASLFKHVTYSIRLSDYRTTTIRQLYFFRYQTSALTNIGPANSRNYNHKKENQIFLIYKEIQSGAVAESNMRKGIYEEMRNISPYMRRPSPPFWVLGCQGW